MRSLDSTVSSALTESQITSLETTDDLQSLYSRYKTFPATHVSDIFFFLSFKTS